MEESNLPRIIHAIWAGGSKPLPAEGIKNLAEWALYNPNFTVQLWVDTEQPPQDIDTLRHNYLTKFHAEYNRLYKEKFKVDPDEPPKVQIKNIREEEICRPKDDLVDYCLDRVIPNYGMSSDILRYRILFKYGGLYVDATDVHTKTEMNVLDNMTAKIVPSCLAWDRYNSHIILIDHLSQNTKPTELQLKEFKISTIGNLTGAELDDALRDSRIGNDTFICTKKNPLILEMIKLCESGFKLKSLTNSERLMTVMHNMFDTTIELTGPQIPQRIICLAKPGELTPVFGGGFIRKIGSEVVMLKPIRCEQYQLTNPVRNTRHWNNVSIETNIISSIEMAFIKLEKTIRFELQHMGILRLDDHFRDLKHVAQKLNKNTEETCIIFLKNLEQSNLPLQQLNSAQHVVGNIHTEAFLTKNNLNKHNTLMKLRYDDIDPNTPDMENERESERKKTILFYANITCYYLFKSSPMFSDQILNKWTTKYIDDEISPGEQRDLFDKIERSVSFIFYVKNKENDLKALNKFLSLNPELDLTQHFGKIMKKFMDAFLEPDKEISKSQVVEVLNKLHLMGVKNILPPEYLEIKELIEREYKGDPNICLRNLANKNQYAQMIKLLKYFDVNINSTSASNQQTALHYAASKGHIEVVKLLLQNGADDKKADNNNKIPGDIAHLSCQFLLPKSDPSIENKK